MKRFEGKVAVVTGGAGGIGIATAKQLAAEGGRVLIVDLLEGPLRDAAASIGGDGVTTLVGDVTRPEDNERMIRTAVERYGGVDVLVANAGIEGVIQPITDYPVEAFDQVIAVNVRGVWLGLKYAIPAIAKRGGGSIVILSSVAGLRGFPNGSAYAASKHAVVGIAKTAALECAPMKIRVNTVNPSPIDTRMMRSIEEGLAPGAGGEVKKGFEARIPLSRYGSAEEVAEVVAFLASDGSRYCTGGVYSVDGGLTA